MFQCMYILTHLSSQVQPPMFSRPSIPGGPPPFVIPTRPNIEMDDNIDVVIAIVVVVAVLLLVSGNHTIQSLARMVCF